MPATPENSRQPGTRCQLPLLRTLALRKLIALEQGRYVLVASTTSLVYLALVSAGIALGWHYLLAIAAAQVVTVAGAFPAYRTLVFASLGRWPSDLARFLSVWSTGMIAGFVATPFLVEALGMSPLLAQTVSLVVVAVGSYLAHRYVSFRHRSDRSGTDIRG